MNFRISRAGVHSPRMALLLARRYVGPTVKLRGPQQNIRGGKGNIQVTCSTDMALSPSALRQSITKKYHRVESAKGIRLFNNLPEGALVDMSLLGQEVVYTVGEVVHASGKPSNGLTILMEGGPCAD